MKREGSGGVTNEISIIKIEKQAHINLMFCYTYTENDWHVTVQTKLIEFILYCTSILDEQIVDFNPVKLMNMKENLFVGKRFTYPLLQSWKLLENICQLFLQMHCL